MYAGDFTAGNPRGSEAGDTFGANCRCLTWDSAVLAPRLKSAGLRGLALHRFCDGLWCWAPFDYLLSARCWMSCTAFVGLACTKSENVNSGHSMKQLKAVASSRIYCKCAKDGVLIKQPWGDVWKRQHLFLFLFWTEHKAGTSQIPSTGRLTAMESFCNRICLGSANILIFSFP